MSASSIGPLVVAQAERQIASSEPAFNVLIDEGHPLAVVIDVEEPRHGRVCRKVWHHRGLVAVEPKAG
jgi:hypothetical protein